MATTRLSSRRQRTVSVSSASETSTAAAATATANSTKTTAPTLKPATAVTPPAPATMALVRKGNLSITTTTTTAHPTHTPALIAVTPTPPIPKNGLRGNQTNRAPQPSWRQDYAPLRRPQTHQHKGIVEQEEAIARAIQCALASSLSPKDRERRKQSSKKVMETYLAEQDAIAHRAVAKLTRCAAARKEREAKATATRGPKATRGKGKGKAKAGQDVPGWEQAGAVNADDTAFDEAEDTSAPVGHTDTTSPQYNTYIRYWKVCE